MLRTVQERSTRTSPSSPSSARRRSTGERARAARPRGGARREAEPAHALDRAASRCGTAQSDFGPTTREPVPLGPERGLRPVGDADRAEDARQVRLHRLLADRELARDQLVRQALARPSRAPRARARRGRRAASRPRAPGAAPGRRAGRAAPRRARRRAPRARARRARRPSAGSRPRRRRARARICSRSENDVRTTTATRGCASAIRRVASMPSSTGISRSISTTSGPLLRAERDGLLAVRGGADELDVVERRRRGARSPVRTTAWSSAMRSRIIGAAPPA